MTTFCKECGNELREGAKFCPVCGAAVAAEPQPQEQYAPPQAQPAPPQASAYEPMAPEPQPGSQPQAQYVPPPAPAYQQPQQGYTQPQPGYTQPQAPMYAGAYAAPPQKKKLPKPLLIVIIIAAAIAAIVIAANAITGGQEDKDYFQIGKDQVPSVKLVLGEKRNITGYSSSASGGVQTVTVDYKVGSNQNKEMQEYAQALIVDHGYLNTTSYDFNGATGSGFQFAKESDEKGFIVIVTIDYDKNGYKLTLTRGEGTLTITGGGGGGGGGEGGAPVRTEPDDSEPDDPEPNNSGPKPAAGMKEIHIPLIFTQYWEEKEILDEAKAEGFEAVKNPDGSYTYFMTEQQHKKYLEDCKKEFDDLFKSMVESGIYPGMMELKSNADYSEIVISCTGEFLGGDSLGVYALFTIGYSAPFYQVYQGKGEKSKTVIKLNDHDSGELIQTITCPDELYDIFGG